MTLRLADDVVVEAVVISVFFVVSLAVYIILPELGYPDYLQCCLPKPTSWPLKAIGAILPDRMQRELGQSTRCPLAMIWISCVVVVAALCGTTVELWKIDRPHEGSICLFTWQGSIICFATIVEILQTLLPACQVLAKLGSTIDHGNGSAWTVLWFPLCLTAHAIWLGVGIWLSHLELLNCLAMLTHFCSAIPILYIAIKGNTTRISWWSGTVLFGWLMSLTAGLATIWGWRIGHLAAQCISYEVIKWEKPLWKWYQPQHPNMGQGPGQSEGESIRSTTHLMPISRQGSLSTTTEEGECIKEAMDALTEYFIELADGHFETKIPTGHILDVCVETTKWPTEAATLNTDCRFTAVGPCHARTHVTNLEHYTSDVNDPWRVLGDQRYDYIRLAFLDGAVNDWNIIVSGAAKHLKPGGVVCVTDIKVRTDYTRWVEAEDRMRAHTGSPSDALRREGFKVEDRGTELNLRIGQGMYNDCDLFGAVLERAKQFFMGALRYSPGSGHPRELLAKLEQNLNTETSVRIVRLVALKDFMSPMTTEEVCCDDAVANATTINRHVPGRRFPSPTNTVATLNTAACLHLVSQALQSYVYNQAVSEV